MNQENDPNLVYSGLCQHIKRDGVEIEVCIIRLEHEKDWTLEVVNDKGTSIVWDDTFPTDKAAFEELERTIAKEGMASFLDNANVIPFPK